MAMRDHLPIAHMFSTSTATWRADAAWASPSRWSTVGEEVHIMYLESNAGHASEVKPTIFVDVDRIVVCTRIVDGFSFRGG